MPSNQGDSQAYSLNNFFILIFAAAGVNWDLTKKPAGLLFTEHSASGRADWCHCVQSLHP